MYVYSYFKSGVTSNNIWYLPTENAKLVAEKCKIGCQKKPQQTVRVRTEKAIQACDLDLLFESQNL